MTHFKSYADSILKPYSTILFLDNRYAGLLLLCVTFINPSVALSGLAAVGFTILFAELIDLREHYLSQPFYLYNSLLVGMGIGYIFAPTLTSMALVAVSASFTFMLSFMFNRIFSVYALPILSLPFAIVTPFLYMASLKYTSLLTSIVNNATLYDISLPFALSGFFKSVGTIFFLPNNLAGILMVIIVLYFSRILVFMALTGYYFGTLVHSFFIASYQEALADPFAFNYILVAIALCGIFLLPTIRSFLLALIGVALSVVLTDAIGMMFQYYAIPVFTLPFNITVTVFIFILSVIYYKEFNIQIKATPEASLSNYLSKVFRFGDLHPQVALPFTGKWCVYQAFDGRWTHKGKYRFAYDFVKKVDGKSYRNDGLYVNDYYCFGESVLSPVSGYVVDMRHDLPDNAIGEVDRINNWGNYIIIKSDLGFYVELSHLMYRSVSVTIGEYVQANRIIAKCGNSGYSPEPHIHIQVQHNALLGGFTRKFRFSEYIRNGQLYHHTTPKEEEEIEAVISDRSIQSRFLFILDDVLCYDIYENGSEKERVYFHVRMESDGSFFFEDQALNRLYFHTGIQEFYFYDYRGEESYLKMLFITAPRIPFLSQKEVTFTDYLPIFLIASKLERISTELIATVYPQHYKRPFTYRFDGKTLASKHGYVRIGGDYKGFEEICFGQTKLLACKG